MALPPHRVLIAEEQLARRVGELAGEIADRAPASLPLHVIGLLDGSFVFLADLARALSRRGLDPRLELARTSLYGSGTEPAAEVSLLHDFRHPLDGRAVLLVDDILDSGRTLALVRERVLARRPAWLGTCVLLDKPARRVASVSVDFVGFTVPDTWVVGYGMDLDGHGRGLPYIAELVR